MSLKKYRVISESFWDGVQLHKQGAEITLETDDVQVAWDSRSLQPLGDAPVYETDKEGNKKVSSKKPKAAKPPEPGKPEPAKPVMHGPVGGQKPPEPKPQSEA